MNRHSNSGKIDTLPFSASVFASFLTICFGANAIAIKLSLVSLSAFAVSSVRFFIAAVLLFLWSLLTKNDLKIKPGEFVPLAVMSLIFTVQLGLFYTGFENITASRGILIVNLQPFMVLVASHFLTSGEKISLKKLVGVFMGFSGIVLVFFNGLNLSGNFGYGEFIMLSATVIWTGNALYTKKILSGIDPLKVVFYPMIVAVPVHALIALYQGKAVTGEISFTVVGAILYQAVVIASFGFMAWTALIKKYSVFALHSHIFLSPVSGVLLGGIILSEDVFNFKILLSLAFIATGIYIINYHENGHFKEI